MGVISKFRAKMQYKNEMKKMSKQMAECKKLIQKNDIRIQEMNKLLRADMK